MGDENLTARAFEKFKKDGAVGFFKSSARFVLSRLPGGQRKYVNLSTWANYGRYHEAPVDPFRVLWIDPHDIIYHQAPKPAGGYHNKMFSYVLEGDWDRNLPPFEEHYVYQFIRDRYEHDIPAENTDFFEHFQEELSVRGMYWNGCESIEDFYERCTYLDELYEEVREHGMKTTEQLRAEGRYNGVYPDNIHINIGRNGEFIYLNGRHRLSIAKILDIEVIPVNVMVRHADWQAMRDTVACSDEPSDLGPGIKQHLDHSDIEYLIRTN